jgi:hypothetical protein
MKLTDRHTAYLQKIAKSGPLWSPAEWPPYMVELFKAGYIDKVGKSIHLTEKGWSAATP